MNKSYKNPDNHPKGPWKSTPLHAKSGHNSDFEYVFKNGVVWKPPKGTFPRFSEETLRKLEKDNAIWFGKDGKSIPSRKTFLSDLKQDGVPARTIWMYDEVGHNHEAREEVKAFNPVSVFATPKPEKLLKQIFSLATQEGDLILDSFLGSGTSAAVAHKMARNFIGIELREQASTHCIPRLEKVIEGEQGGISKEVNWQGGGGFTFYKLGERAFDKKGKINPKISFEALASFVWQQETGTALEPKKRPLLGTFKDLNIFLLYNGVLGDKRPEAGNVLTPKILKMLEAEYPVVGDKLIYGEAIFGLSEEELKAKNITFKQIPYDIR